MKRTGRIVTEATQAYSFSRRAWLLGGAQAGVGLLLAGRMAWLSVAQNAKYNLLSESNRVNATLVPPRRGWIIDRHGLPVANNRTDFRVDILPDRLPKPERERVLALLTKLLQLTPEDLERIRIDLDRAAGFQPVQIAEKLDWDRFAAVSVRLPELPGVQPTRGFARHYPAGAAVAHLTGYVGAPTAEQYRATHDALLVTPGFKLGKDGLEKTLEPMLRGKPGARRAEVTARGKLVAELATRPDVPGRNARLTIDVGLQEFAARRLGTNSGSAVVIDCRTGEMLCMVSMPAYDPNSFSDGISHLEWEMLSKNDHVPLMNKVTQGLYPPGSTVKPMHALALMENGVSPDERVFCSGALRVGTGVFHCHKRGGHGPLDMRNAVAQSCDIYFYEMIRRLGYDKVAPIARELGLGQKFDLPFTTQRYGTVPDSAWKLGKYKRPWTVADSLNASIGQGYVLTNPLQLAVMVARMASGRALVPSILADQVHRDAPALPFQSENLQVAREAMWKVVNGGGTGGAARLLVPGLSLAGKTGTAQVRRITMAERRVGVLKNAQLPFKLRDHALLVCFAPAENPRYACAVVLEHNGHTVRTLDTPYIGRDILTYLLDRDRALATLAELEPTWGGDIATRMAADEAAYRAAHSPPPAAAATKTDAVVPSDAPAVEEATALANRTQAALSPDTPGPSVAEEGTTERSTDE
ncbi:penicillin-binding protein 2 [Sphingomonas sp. SORGH_AS802]|uniref:penicillin-binding protein 2 n=1 Tax=unclassified Sphingomonas TaxID=196159 RepID=UPI002856E229|nr:MULTISPECIES: penicillin-binding protein 2 [unclassified Sphingomonas]MDR6127041.1 penicillin-binding protein 2 [Sphingomonas sp. SORGH_AS_0438]MDR6134597.1 penicillin-binding protein 2 [Sphingomonas sp. SORGH_AS_0802]